MREPNDDGLVPPLKVLRRRVNGVYRADGFGGPTRRYVLIVALLVGLASLPTLAAITAGSNELNDGTTGAMDVPLFPPPSALPSPSVSPSAPAVGEAPAVGGDVVQGQAGERSAAPRPSKTAGRVVRPDRDAKGYGAAPPTRNSDARPGELETAPTEKPKRKPKPPSKPSSPPKPSPVRPGSPSVPGTPDVPEKPDIPDAPGRPGSPGNDWSWQPGRHDPPPPADEPDPWRPADPEDPAEPSRPGRPACHDREKCGSHPSHHHRPDRSRHKHCDDADHQSQPRKVKKLLRSFVSNRSDDRSVSSRRSSMTERPHNVRHARTADRTHNSRRHHADSRPDEAQSRTGSYRGSHRAERQHRADDSGAHHRTSRVGRHHAERTTRW